MGKSLWSSTPKDWEPLVLPERLVLKPLSDEERAQLDKEHVERVRPFLTKPNPFWPLDRY